MKTSLSRTTILVYFVGVLGTFLIMAVMIALVKNYVQPAPVNKARIDERRKASADAAVAAQQLQTYAVIDAAKGRYQIRIDQAIEMVLKGSQNPAAFRSDLLAREAKFNAPPPNQPEKPSQFE
jgi:hypothetical protein